MSEFRNRSRTKGDSTRSETLNMQSSSPENSKVIKFSHRTLFYPLYNVITKDN